LKKIVLHLTPVKENSYDLTTASQVILWKKMGVKEVHLIIEDGKEYYTGKEFRAELKKSSEGV